MNISKGVLLTLIGGIFWGFSGVAGKYLFEFVGVTSDWLVPWRLLFSGIILLIYFYIRERNHIFSVWKEDWKSLCIYSIFGIMACQYSYFTTVQYSNAAVATILQYTAPPFIMLYMCYRERKKPRWIEVLALFFACGGIFILSTHLQISTLVISPKALFWGIISSIATMIYSIQPIKLLKKYGSCVPLAWAMVLGGVILYLYLRPYEVIVEYTWKVYGAMFIVIVLGTVFAYSLYTYGVKLIGPTRASVIACIEPISATILSILLLKISFTFLDILGMVLILLAVCLLAYPKLNE